MTTVQLNSTTRKVEVFSSARDTQARADIAALEARTMADWNYVPDVTGGATRTQAAWNDERRSFADFEAGGGVSAWNRALTWLNGGHHRTLYLPGGAVALDTTSLDPITGFHKAIIGQGMSTRLIKPSGSGTNNLMFRIGDTSASSAARIQLSGFQVDFVDWATASGAAFIVDGADDVIIELARATNVVSLLELGPTPDVFCNKVMLEVHGGNWRAEGNQHFIHQKRAVAVDIPKCLCNSANGGTGYAYHLEAQNHSNGKDAGNNDGVYLDRFEVWAGQPGRTHVPHIIVLDATNGQIGNIRVKSHGLDHTTDSAVLLKADSNAHRMEKVRFYGCRSTPYEGQAIRLENNGTGFWEHILYQADVDARDAHVIEVAGSGWYESIQFDVSIAYKGEVTPQLNDLVRIGASNVSAKITSGPGLGTFPGRTPYNYVVAITADVDNVNLNIQDNGADEGLVEHFAYASGGSDIVVNGRAYSKASEASVGEWHVLANSAATGMSHTGDTDETALATYTIPAGTMGPNDILRITSVWAATGTNAKTLGTRLGGLAGTFYGASTLTTQASDMRRTYIMARNSTSAQLGGPVAATGGWGAVGAGVQASGLDMSVAQDIVFSAQLTDSGESATLHGYIIEIMRRS